MDLRMDDELTMGAARARYYAANQFGDDGGDALKWVPIKLWRFTVRIPNSDGRRRAVRIHDLHHVVTGYQTDLRGEAEIAAWELASGCLRWPAATVLNSFALGIGVLLSPRRVVRAWAHGRHTRNLYGHDGVDHLLPRPVADVRAELGLAPGDAPPRVRLRDALAVALVAIPMLAVMAAMVLAPIAAIALMVRAVG